MKKFILQRKAEDKYISFSESLKYYIGSDKTKAHNFTYEEAKKFISESNHKYGYLVIKKVYNEEINDSINDLGNTDDVDSIFNIVKNLGATLENLKEVNYEKLRKLENALLDINHCNIDGDCKLSNNDIIKMDNLRNSIIDKRKEIKDNLIKINIMKKSINPNYNMQSDIDRMNSRIYTPRELDMLFKEKKIPNFEDWWDE